MGSGTIGIRAGVTEWQGRSTRRVRLMQFSDWAGCVVDCSALLCLGAMWAYNNSMGRKRKTGAWAFGLAGFGAARRFWGSERSIFAYGEAFLMTCYGIAWHCIAKFEPAVFAEPKQGEKKTHNTFQNQVDSRLFLVIESPSCSRLAMKASSQLWWEGDTKKPRPIR
ncbi:hypothetical protein GJ744_009733 [Endocarpon pusillum]|uniref:Uncharacterized protein n=1 Tax=Endocarpon pusillum TaxID=364733 RepID=A0A8H7E8M3_9EURO|nr:hypothetical protein GJ744_009733 [Endocarpon pusillum]